MYAIRAVNAMPPTTPITIPMTRLLVVSPSWSLDDETITGNMGGFSILIGAVVGIVTGTVAFVGGAVTAEGTTTVGAKLTEWGSVETVGVSEGITFMAGLGVNSCGRWCHRDNKYVNGGWCSSRSSSG